MEPRGAIGVDQALRATAFRYDAVGPIGIESAAVVVIHLALDANQPRFIAAVRGRRALLILAAALRADSCGQVAGVVARAILVESALDAAMKRRIATSEPARLAVEVSHAFEADSAL